MNNDGFQIVVRRACGNHTFATLVVTIMCLCAVCIITGSCSKGSPHQIQVATGKGFVCADGIWDIGEVDSTESPSLTHIFKLENHSKKSIAIKSVSSSCGCMVIDNFKKILSPGEISEVKVSLNLSPMPGPIREDLLVETIIPESYMFLRITGNKKLNGSLCSFPALLDFGTVIQGRSAIRTLRIMRYDKSPVRFKEASFEDHHLSLSHAPVKQEEGRIEIAFRLDASGLNAGSFSSAIVLVCPHKLFTELKIPVRARVEQMNGGE